MTLKEFVKQVLAENNLQSDPDQIIKTITDIARARAVNNVAAISDGEVREMVINNADLANRLAEEQKQKKARQEAEKAEAERQKELKKAEEKRQKELKKAEEERMMENGEQTTLF